MNLDFTKCDGLIPAIVQDHRDGRVLMLGFMNEQAFARTAKSGKVTFYSRTRNKLWTKGESSGHSLLVKRIETDCDVDTLLIQAEAIGPGVCHDGFRSCFSRRLEDGSWVRHEERTYDPAAVYAT